MSTRGELDELEQHNIEEATEWMRRSRAGIDEILTEQFVKEVHRRMFGEVWTWAGAFRNTNKNLGVEKTLISTYLLELLRDARYWIDERTFSDEEAAVRVKHRIVSIHCFANGNGRHSRLYADILVSRVFKKTPFTWGDGEIGRPGEVRAIYLAALRAADHGDLAPLTAFARSSPPAVAPAALP